MCCLSLSTFVAPLAITPLKPYTMYTVRLAALNAVGVGKFSDGKNIRTQAFRKWSTLARITVKTNHITPCIICVKHRALHTLLHNVQYRYIWILQVHIFAHVTVIFVLICY